MSSEDLQIVSNTKALLGGKIGLVFQNPLTLQEREIRAGISGPTSLEDMTLENKFIGFSSIPTELVIFESKTILKAKHVVLSTSRPHSVFIASSGVRDFTLLNLIAEVHRKYPNLRMRTINDLNESELLMACQWRFGKLSSRSAEIQSSDIRGGGNTFFPQIEFAGIGTRFLARVGIEWKQLTVKQPKTDNMRKSIRKYLPLMGPGDELHETIVKLTAPTELDGNRTMEVEALSEANFMELFN